MKKYVYWGLTFILALIIISNAKIRITFDNNNAQADSIINFTTEDADKYLNDAIRYSGSQSVSTQDAQIAEAIYAKKTYELLKEQSKK